MLELLGERALITGATSGIGKATAVALAAAGATVAVSGRDTDKGRAVVEAIGTAGGSAGRRSPWSHGARAPEVPGPETPQTPWRRPRPRAGRLITEAVLGRDVSRGRASQMRGMHRRDSVATRQPTGASLDATERQRTQAVSIDRPEKERAWNFATSHIS
jgi:NAD(P)-dependent dehydrogenase (short-subunit alcohol dehydrogenase family)